jgi:enhanced entry protein EnhC
MYHDGLGVTQDKTRSIELYQQLAERQNPDAQYQLGTYYLEGSEGQRMPDKAKQLLQQASDNGNKKATQTLQRLQRLQANQRQVSRS